MKTLNESIKYKFSPKKILTKNHLKKAKKNITNVLNYSEICEDTAFLVPNILEYCNCIGVKYAVLPYAIVSTIFDTAKIVCGITDIINEFENRKKLRKIGEKFKISTNIEYIKDTEKKLFFNIKKIQKKNEKKHVKNIFFNTIRMGGDIFCFSYVTWIYGESIKVTASAMEILCSVCNRIKQAGRDAAEKRGAKSFYAKIFNVEKSTANKIQKRREIIRLVNESFKNFVKNEKYDFFNKNLNKLELYLDVLGKYQGSVCYKQKLEKLRKKRIQPNSRIPRFWEPTKFINVFQFQRIILMAEFLREMTDSTNKIFSRYTIKKQLSSIKLQISNKKLSIAKNEYELVKFLKKHNKKYFTNLMFSISIFGTGIMGEFGELITYFRDSIFGIIGLTMKLGGVFAESIRLLDIKLKRKCKKKAIYVDCIIEIIENLEKLNFNYPEFYLNMSRIKIYLGELDLKWGDVVAITDKNVRKAYIEQALL